MQQQKINLKTIFNDERIRAKGRIRFIFETGILRWGIAVTILTEISGYVYSYGFKGANIGELFTGQNIFYVFLEILITGFIFGELIWVYGKKENYQKLNL